MGIEFTDSTKMYYDSKLLGEITEITPTPKWGIIDYEQNDHTFPNYDTPWHKPMDLEFSVEIDKNLLSKLLPSPFEILDDAINAVIFENPSTTIKWKDGAVTTVSAQDDEAYDKEKGFAMAVLKYLNRGDADYNDIVKKYCE